MIYTILVDGEPRNVVASSKTAPNGLSPETSYPAHVRRTFFLDDPSLPGRPCSCHSLTYHAIQLIAKGGACVTNGHRYSLPEQPETA
jgi:hypothetical protein